MSQKLPGYFYSKTVNMEYLIFALSLLFGYSLSIVIPLGPAIILMGIYMISFTSIERWDNPKKHVPFWRRS